MTSLTVSERRRLTVIRASWLFDGTGSVLIADPLVVFDGATIRSAESGGAAPEGARVLDLDGATLLRDREDQPAVVAAGPPITSPGGHCHFLNGVAEPTESGMRAAVREHVERGVDVIKIVASGGTMTPGTRQECAQFDAGVLRAAVDEAHRQGLPVTAHAHGTPAIADVCRSEIGFRP
jgi:Amidohydrolase family